MNEPDLVRGRKSGGTSARERTGSDGERLNRYARAALRPAYRLLTPIQVTNPERLPPHGGAILAANHVSFYDTIVLMLSVPRRTFFVGKAEYLDSWKTRRLFPALGLIPIDRQASRSATTPATSRR